MLKCTSSLRNKASSLNRIKFWFPNQSTVKMGGYVELMVVGYEAQMFLDELFKSLEVKCFARRC
jgi:hypothetical protein